MNRIRDLIFAFAIGIVLCLFLLPLAHGGDLPEDYHVVVRGDTLYRLAKAHWGDGKLYPQLAELNKIANPHLIHVGQKIWFAEPLTEREKIRIAREVVWTKMVSTFKITHGRVFDTPTVSRAWALNPLHIIDKGMPTPRIRGLLKEIWTRLEWTDLTLLHKSIMAEAETAEDLLLLASMADHESDFRNVEGAHGEIGPMQMMPETGLQVIKNNTLLSSLTLEGVVGMLWDIPTNIWASWTHFKSLLARTSGKIFGALRKYNGHGEPTKIYANKVMVKFRSYSALYNKELGRATMVRIEQRIKGGGEALNIFLH